MTHGPGGFSPEGLAFLAGLEADNSKGYFDAHRSVYTSELADPMKELVDAVADELRASVAPGIEAEAKVGRSLFRINRDTRFSKDKTPYKTYLDAIWWEGTDSPKTAPCFLFRLTSDHVVVGCGLMGMDKDVTARFRAAIDDATTGPDLESVIREITASYPDIALTEPTRKRVPPPYSQDHPRAALLRLDSIHATRSYPMPSQALSGSFPEWIAGQQAAFAPLQRWLVSNLT